MLMQFRVEHDEQCRETEMKRCTRTERSSPGTFATIVKASQTFAMWFAQLFELLKQILTDEC